MEIIIDNRAKREFDKLSTKVQNDFYALMQILQKDGRLSEPHAKKLVGSKNLFEIRVKSDGGQYRGFYCYIKGNNIVVLHFSRKKSQKTPQKTLKLIIQRQKDYQ